MSDYFSEVFSSSGLMPHGYCFLWRPGLLWLHVVSDALILAAYFSIPFALLTLVRKRSDLTYDRIVILFGLFILLCGATHLMSIWSVWQPVYWLAGLVKAATAVVSVGTGIVIWPTLPKLLALPSPSQLLRVNQELAEALEKYKTAVNELKKFSLAVEHSSSMVIVTDTNGLIEYCNPAFCAVTGYDKSEVLGKKTSILRSGYCPQETYRDLWQRIGSGQPWHGEFIDRKKDGEAYWCLEYIAPIKDEAGAIINYVAISHDISELKHSQETIRRLAFYDPLTALPNRTLFNERIGQTLLRAKRNNSLFALMYVDLDRFKNINDTLGHFVGDKLLILAGQRLRKQLREEDVVARLGGDEFAIVLSDIQHIESIANVAESISSAMNQPFKVDGFELFATASIGISVYPMDHCEIDQLTRMADTALYSAKDKGRNKFEFYSELSNQLSVERLTLEMDLRYAAQRGELMVYYQPKFDLAHERIVGLEALLRWNHPRYHFIPPVQFIPVAEETGLIIQLGEWVLREVCQQINAWAKMGIHWPVAINLSARQLREAKLFDNLDNILAETGVDPRQLEFEITESMIMGNPEKALSILHSLKARGISLSIDDFGTGYSSLSYLKRFPVDTLKIDMSFVHDITTDKDSASIVKAVISLAHSLGLKVIAEGVESREQADYLRTKECDEVQGYYYGTPLPAGELVERFSAAQAAEANVSQDFQV
jgi:diguanylate cyclase (GGDEF)-like protein/PAS domain S-box-containing protein